ncbi:DUF4258 domain-containing protein [Desulfonema ishimotonii]|uniref:DUF4258 domain-containing protein n=1 Tax=Desulfonema ishimotonii TaxID=45657 RepID=A0A401G2S4_9BACT|nr:DUF4258 domain-containing protein [Desulfonema ishimotonii]GBC63549.1 DUF4258 domain-containing protein [Desulfonema ishimotonii]
MRSSPSHLNFPATIESVPLTFHAKNRMNSRGVTPAAVKAVLRYGRCTYIRGAKIYAIGKKEVEYFRETGVDLSGYEGIHAVCSTDENSVITVYRNHNFRKLRPRGRCQKWYPACKN